ncbi:DNA-formamidopyrimidine glycosylase family protein [Chitinophaga sancti]|uniref:DNA-formamidopyrimidine glycosylase family protein n=1 Tax=Chitinophaga sancti TaxID=1004 RepID=UPI003F797DBA
MPEIPDLEVFSMNLTKLLKEKVVKKLEVPFPKKLKTPIATLKKQIEKKQLTEIYREGKQLRLAFGKDIRLGWHLMLHGEPALFEGNKYPKWTIIALQFTDGSGLAMTDFQGQAMVTLNPEESEVPDAMSKQVNTKYLQTVLSNSKKKIKDVLMNQDLIRGLGNAYTDEILYEARISPFSVADRIPAARVKVLASSIKKVLKDGMKQILKHNKDLISGEYRDFMKVHHARKEKSPGGASIQSHKVGSRKTYYTDEQELF